MANFFSRLLRAGASTHASALDQKASRTGPLIAHLTYGSVRYAPRTAVELTQLGYQRNPVAYRAVRMVAEAAASITWRAYEGRDEIDHHPALALLARPNPAEIGPAFLESLISNLLLFGNAYVEAARIDGEVRELYALRPDRMAIIPGPNGWPAGFEYQAGGERVRFDMLSEGVSPILHLKLFHPLDDHYGFAPVQAAQCALETHDAAANWNRALLDNAARPSGALVYSGPDGTALSDEQFTRLKAELEENFSGPSNSGRPLLLEGGLDWKALSLSPKDMDFIQAKHAAAREIALAFGVPPLLLGLPGDNTYANYQEANRAFWRQTVIPLVARIQKSFAAWLAPAYGEFTFDYDVDRLDSLADERTKEWTRIGAASFLTDDEKREAVGYGPRVKKDGGSDGVDVAAPADGATGDGPGGGGDGANGGAWRDQPRDAEGRWTDGGGGGAQVIQASDKPVSQAVGEWTPEKGLVQTLGTGGGPPGPFAPFLVMKDETTPMTNPYVPADKTDGLIRGPWAYPPEAFIELAKQATRDADILQLDPISRFYRYLTDLRQFRQNGPLDLQRLETGRLDDKYVDYASVAIGVYSSAAGIPRSATMYISSGLMLT
jgi:HK97 family phage portal protein